MPKIKTHQAVAKRFRVTKNKKILKKKCGQNHFNSRETGKVSRLKRRPAGIASATIRKSIRRLITRV